MPCIRPLKYVLGASTVSIYPLPRPLFGVFACSRLVLRGYPSSDMGPYAIISRQIAGKKFLRDRTIDKPRLPSR